MRPSLLDRPALVLVCLMAASAGFVGCASDGFPVAPAVRATHASQVPWVEISEARGDNGSRVSARIPQEIDRIDRVLRTRVVYRREGIDLGHLMLGSGALYPYHSHASPEAFHVLSGEAEWSVDGETRRVGPGTTIYHAPYADHRWVTTSKAPLRVVWVQWLPNGDRSGLLLDAARRRGGSVTGDFFPGERRSRNILVTEMFAPVVTAEAGSTIDSMRRARLWARGIEGKRLAVRAFVDSVGIPWNAEIEGVRWRALFGTLDLEWGHVEISGPGEREVPASAAPGVLHVLSGRAEARVAGGERIVAEAGTTLSLSPGEAIRFEFEAGVPEPLRAMWVRWAPDGDLGYWKRDYFLLEPMPEPSSEAALAKDVPFFP